MKTLSIADTSKLLLDRLSQIDGIKQVDMYYGQDEKIINIGRCPAILFNIASIRYEKSTAQKDYRHTEYGINLYLLNPEGSQPKEIEAQKLIYDLYKTLKSIPDITIKDTVCIERTANLTIYATTIEHKELEIL